jgi:trehalose synthase
VHEVAVRPLAPERLAPLIGPARYERFEALAAAARTALAGRVVWNVNSTATGGGVAELLQTLLAYARGVGVDARWLVVRGDEAFFRVTKRIHNRLYGTAGDGGALDAAARRGYERVLEAAAGDLAARVGPDDVVLLHDPQTAALAPPLRDRGTPVVWRCHVGIDAPSPWADEAWEFLRPYVAAAQAWVFSRAEFAPPWIPADRRFVIAPSIDPFSAKNTALVPAQVRAVLGHAGLLAGDPGPDPGPFRRRDGSPGRIRHRADLVGTGPVPSDAPLVLQASRWDRLKDMAGVMQAFADSCLDGTDAHLLLAGPAAAGVADDPEAEAVLADCRERWAALPAPARARVHLACVPMEDPDEAALVVNALQRHARVVAQKSLAEGFGLTVAEAMWKGRPVVGSRVGGIADQVVDGETGRLVAPHDLAGFAVAVRTLIADPGLAERQGRAAARRAHEHFLGDRHLEQWAELLLALLGA